MRKQQICFFFLFLIFILIALKAMAGFNILMVSSPWPIKPGRSEKFTITAYNSDDGSAASDETVTFSVSPDDGTVALSTTSTTTDSDGKASTVLRTTSDSSGLYTVTATFDNGQSISSTATVETPLPPPEPEPEPELSISVISGPGSGEPGGNLTFVVKVQEDGSAASGETVTFSVSRNDGTVSLNPKSATTGSDGRAQTTLTLGNGATGSYTITASVGGQSTSGTATVETPPPQQQTSEEEKDTTPVDAAFEAHKAEPPGHSSHTSTGAHQHAAVTHSHDDYPLHTHSGYVHTHPAEPDPITDPVKSALVQPDSDAVPQDTTTPVQKAAPEGSTGNTPGTPRSVTTNTPADTNGTLTPDTLEQQASDLVVSIPVVSKTVLDSGESFTISVTVENIGEGLSPETILRYYRGSDIGVSGTEVGKKTVSPIAAMGRSDVSISLTAPDAPGTYLYYACVSSITGGSNTGNTCTPNSVQLTVRGEPQDTSEPQGTSKYDVNGDGAVDIEDAALVVGALGTNTAKYDVDGDGRVDVADLLLIIQNRQEAASAPSVVGMKFTAAQIDRIQAQVVLLAATNDRSPAAIQTLAYLRNLVAMARPEKTQLLTNYPNPFNPETWIPYRLAAAANVTLTIYDINGQVVRQLALGHQAAGMYQTRSRAAYWDGRNAFGEPVASGLYFYTLTTGDFTATRKMLIRK